MTADIFEIKRFAVHDGDGIRTTVFFKGCPLRCVWCHNPEGLSSKPQLGFYKHKCVNCGECASVCPTGAHTIEDGTHRFDRMRCIACGKCADICLGNALQLYGNSMTVDELLPLLLEDRDFYETSGGGVTLSGGECLLHAEFCAELLKALKTNGIHTAVDTCGDVPRLSLDAVIPYTDIFLFDLKAIDETTHRRCTGHSNRQILENLRYLDACGCAVEIRYPYVPDWNSAEAEAIAGVLSELTCVTKIRVLPYHNFAASKYAALGISHTLPPSLPSVAELEQARQLLQTLTGLTVLS